MHSQICILEDGMKVQHKPGNQWKTIVINAKLQIRKQTEKEGKEKAAKCVICERLLRRRHKNIPTHLKVLLIQFKAYSFHENNFFEQDYSSKHLTELFSSFRLIAGWTQI